MTRPASRSASPQSGNALRPLPSSSSWPRSCPRARSTSPSFPDIALRVRKVLADENVTQDKVVRVVGSEPALAARLMQIANSAALNFTGKPITELRTAIARMGFNMVRSAAIAFAMSQLKKVDSLKGLEKPLDELWKRSAAVAAMSHAVARRSAASIPIPRCWRACCTASASSTSSRAPTSTRACSPIRPPTTPSCATGTAPSPRRCSRTGTWPRRSSTAVSEYEDFERQNEGQVDLTDVLTVGYLLASFKEHPETIELNMHDVAACKRMGIDRASYEKLIDESEHEIDALRQALGV